MYAPRRKTLRQKYFLAMKRASEVRVNAKQVIFHIPRRYAFQTIRCTGDRPVITVWPDILRPVPVRLPLNLFFESVLAQMIDQIESLCSYVSGILMFSLSLSITLNGFKNDV
jgi:hypothetical protein